MNIPRLGRPLSSGVSKLADADDAVYWARVCAWLPGTGQCRAAHCSVACAFQRWREDERRRIERLRRRRRTGPRGVR